MFSVRSIRRLKEKVCSHVCIMGERTVRNPPENQGDASLESGEPLQSSNKIEPEVITLGMASW